MLGRRIVDETTGLQVEDDPSPFGPVAYRDLGLEKKTRKTKKTLSVLHLELFFFYPRVLVVDVLYMSLFTI